jgi:hypothetical protein
MVKAELGRSRSWSSYGLSHLPFKGSGRLVCVGVFASRWVFVRGEHRFEHLVRGCRWSSDQVVDILRGGRGIDN